MNRQQQEGSETLNTLTNGTLYNKTLYSKVQFKTSNEQQTSTQTDADATTIKLRRFGENDKFFVDQRQNSSSNISNSKKLYKSYVDMLDEVKTRNPWERRHRSVDFISKAPPVEKIAKPIPEQVLPKIKRNSNHKIMKSSNFERHMRSMFEMSHSHFHRNINMKTLNQSHDSIKGLLQAAPTTLPKKLLKSRCQNRSSSP